MTFIEGMDTVQVEKHETEPIYFAIVLILSIVMWILLTVSVIGIIYLGLIALFFFVTHIGFIAYVRGNAVRISADQFPELNNRITELSKRIGLFKPPDAYIMQAGGALNALATKLFSDNFIILYSDLLDACGENHTARDMIIGHELGHIKAGHLKLTWLILPGLLFPFIGTALSRAREYTCDKYGAALCGDLNGAKHGLAILSAGPKYAKSMNLEAFVKQQNDLNTGVMTIGRWLSTHPPLSERIALIDPSLLDEKISFLKGRVHAGLIVFIFTVIPCLLSISLWQSFAKMIEEAKVKSANNNYQATETEYYKMTMSTAEAKSKVAADFIVLSKLAYEVKAKTNSYPSENSGMLSSAWELLRPGKAEPKDPFDGNPYGYYLQDKGFVIWSPGPDRQAGTSDDIIYRSANYK